MRPADFAPSKPYSQPVEPQPPAKKALRPFENFMVYVGSKAFAVSCFQPFLAIKYLIQAQATENVAQGKSFQAMKLSSKAFDYRWLNPFILYRGVGINLLNAPLFGVMGTVNAAIKEHLSPGKPEKLSQRQKLLISLFSCGLATGPWTTLDLLILQRQWQNRIQMPHRTDLKPLLSSALSLDDRQLKELWQKERTARIEAKAKLKTVRQITQEIVAARGLKVLFRGFPETFFREVPFGTSLIFLGPEAEKLIHAKIQKKWNFDAPLLALFASGIGVGSLTAFLTQPVDVVKTARQKFWNPATHPQYFTILAAITTIAKEGREEAIAAHQDTTSTHWAAGKSWRSLTPEAIGRLGSMRAFYTGLSARLAVVCVATTAIIEASKQLKGFFESQK